MTCIKYILMLVVAFSSVSFASESMPMQSYDIRLVCHVVDVIAVLTYKLSILILAYLIGRLGYQLLLKGITGDFKFSGGYKGVKADLISGSPGTFFILLGVILACVAVISKNDVNYNIVDVQKQLNEYSTKDDEKKDAEMPYLSPNPPIGEHK